MTAALLACIFGCNGSDGNGPVNLPPAQKTDPENPGPQNPENPSSTTPATVTVGNPLPAWTEGCLDIHQINTGRGESAFYILPDGTTMLIDAAGSLLKTSDKPPTPSKPNDQITSGAVIIDYVKAYMPEVCKGTLDYMLLSHFHGDHMGSWSTSVPKHAGGFYMNGYTEVGAEIPVAKFLDRGTRTNRKASDMIDSGGQGNYDKFIAWAKKTNASMDERFIAGRDDQIVLKHTPEKYSTFSVRNIAANGDVWTGSGSTAISQMPAADELMSWGADKEEDLERRAPIITVMGHVDHGKTSLLDYIRQANVIAGEAGGITQHIGAYNVTLKDGRHVTFLDTPGHEAFTAMRARGAQVTDIAIIIIAADDSIMPQTKEAIAHATAANVPIVFAINKIDKPTANPEKIKEGLAAMNFLVEDWGGKYQSQDISAKAGIGVEELLEKVLLEAEMLDLKANPNRKATGSIIESSLDKGRGYVATVLVSNGTLRVGDVMLAGTNYGRVKAMFDERGRRVNEIGPSQAATILGLNGAPTAGDTFHIMENDQEAREIANKREQLAREQGLRTMKRVDLTEIGRRIALGDFQELNLLVKGDVDGSIEALKDSFERLSTEKIKVNVIYKAVGQISESDVTLAAASDAIIIAFQVRPSAQARRLAEQEGVDIRQYSVIYDAIEEVKDAMEGMLSPEIKEEITAQVEVRQVYHISKVGTVAGAYVIDGKVSRTNKARVIRDGIVVYTGEINALKRFKDDVKEVTTNFECGISLVNYNDLREGDILETFAEIEIKAKL